jgi:hypothetical protein
VGDDRQRRRADIAKPIGARELARRPPPRLHGIALSGVGTTVVGRRSVSSLLPSRSATVRYGTPVSSMAVATEWRTSWIVTFEWPRASASRSLNEYGRTGFVPSGSPAKMYSFGRGPRPVHSRLRASWPSNDSLTESISGMSLQSESLVGLRTRPTPRPPSIANANVHLLRLQVDILDAKSDQLSPANSRPGGAWLHFWLHSHRVLRLSHTDILL